MKCIVADGVSIHSKGLKLTAGEVFDAGIFTAERLKDMIDSKQVLPVDEKPKTQEKKSQE